MPILAFPELFFWSRTLYVSDLTVMHYPLRRFAAQQWLAGQVPLWNPDVLLGFPLLAEGQAGVLYPLNIIMLLPLPTYFALTLFITVHFSLAATFTYGLARLLGTSRLGASLAGLSFGFGGFLMAQLTNLNIMIGSVWLPLLFACLIFAERKRSWPLAVWGGPLFALQILSAQPQILFYTILFLAGYALYQSLLRLKSGPAGRRQALELWLYLALMLLTGGLLAAPQLLPTWELKNLSVRSAGLSYEEIVSYSLAPLQWLSLLFPSLFGNKVLTDYEGLAANFAESHVYAGLLPLVMALFSWRRRQQPIVIFLWLVCLAGLLLSWGEFNPLYRWLHYLPGFSLFRAPARWSLLVNLALSLLAAWGVDAFLADGLARAWRRGLVIGWAALVLIFVGLSLWQAPLSAWLDSLPRPAGLTTTLRLLLHNTLFGVADRYQDRLFLGLLSWWVIPQVACLTRLAGVILLLLAYAGRYLSRQNLARLAIGLTVFDLTLAGGTAINFITGAGYWQQQSAATRFVIEQQQDSPSRIYSLADRTSPNIITGLGEHFPTVPGILATSGHLSSLLLERYATMTEQLKTNPLLALSLTATRLIISPERIGDESGGRLPLVFQDETWYVYENPLALPRAFVASQVITATDGRQALEYLTAPGFDPRQSVILETAEPLPWPAGEPGEAGPVRISRDEANRVEVQAELAGPGLLVLLDNYYPGWQVRVDGQPAPLYRANYFARGVPLAAGRHQIDFVYRPWSFRLGLILSGAGLSLLLGAMLALRRPVWSRAYLPFFCR
jgi:hypothetical protein